MKYCLDGKVPSVEVTSRDKHKLKSDTTYIFSDFRKTLSVKQVKLEREQAPGRYMNTTVLIFGVLQQSYSLA